eukprot:gene29172-38236_t
MFPPTILTAAQAELDSENISPPNLRQNRRSSGNRHRNRGFALIEVTHLSDSSFATMFRMSRAGFEELFNLIAPFMHDTNEHMAGVSAGSAISKRTKLYATLRWLAGGSYLDICFAWGLSKSAFYSTNCEWGVVWPVVDAIDAAFDIGLPLSNVEDLQKLADEFSVLSHGQLPGAVTAIDGWVAQTRKPFPTEVEDIMAYRNRHGCWGLVVLAGCDARCRFTMFSCKNSGSTNDCIACFLYLTLGVVLEHGRIHSIFTYLQCANFDRWSTLLTVLAKLHNFCFDKNIPLYRTRFYEDVEPDDVPDVVLNDDVEDASEELPSAANTYSNRRSNFTRELQIQGIRRPRHASMNFRA